MAAKFEIFEFWKRFWNWLFQKCTFSGLSEILFCRSLKIQILPPFFTKSILTYPILTYWFCSTCRRYMPRCFAPRRAEGPTVRGPKARSLTIILQNIHYIAICSSSFVVDREKFRSRGPEGPMGGFWRSDKNTYPLSSTLSSTFHGILLQQYWIHLCIRCR